MMYIECRCCSRVLLTLFPCQTLATVSTLVLRVSPRKPLFLVCAAAIALSQAGLGTYSFLARGAEAEAEVAGGGGAGEHGWVPLACVMSVNAFRTVGFMVVIQLLLAESFPTEIRYGD